MSQLLKPLHLGPALHKRGHRNEKPMRQNLLPQLGKASSQQQRPSMAKINICSG